MKKVLKAKWVEALRSGKFKQGKGTLYEEADGGEFHCCLGVLCAISPAVARRVKDWKDHGTLSKDALDYAGFNNEEQWNLAEMNDNDTTGFKRIATYIEKYL